MTDTHPGGRPEQVSASDVAAYLDDREAPFLTADAVAEHFRCSDQTARNKLRTLVQNEELANVSLGPGKPKLYFSPDYEAASRTVNILRDHFDLGAIDRNQLAAFADEPYCILPKAENEAYVVVPRFIPFHVGWLDRQTVSYNVFIVNKYINWIDGLPDEIRDQVNISAKYNNITVADGLIEVDPSQREEAWEEFVDAHHPNAIPGDEKLSKMDWEELRTLASRHGVLERGMDRNEVEAALSKERDESQIRIKESSEFDVIAQLIEDGNLPFRPDPVDDSTLRPAPESIELREYQERAWEQFVKTGLVGIYWPPGAGKTFVSLYAGERLRGDKLVVVPNNTLKEQWQQRIRDFCTFTEEWEVQTYQYLTRSDNIHEYEQDGPVLTIFDECHHLPANTFAKLSTIDTNHRIGLSASPYREDGRTEYIFALTGFPVGLNWKELVAIGAVETPDAKLYLYKSQEEKFSDVTNIIENHPGKTLILCDIIDRGKELSAELGVPFVHGGTRDRMQKFENNHVVIGSRVADEGLSLDELDVVIEYDFHGRSRRQETQRYGRAMHGNSTGEHLIMMTDAEYDKYSQRLMALEEKGIKIAPERRD